MAKELRIKRLKDKDGATYEELAARCKKLGWDVSSDYLRKVFIGNRGTVWENCEVLSKVFRGALSAAEIMADFAEARSEAA